MLKLLTAIALCLVIVLLLVTPVLAYLYRAPLSFTENASNAYTMLPLMAITDNLWMADNGFMASTALDTLVETLSGSQKPHMVAEDRTLTAVPLPADSQTNLYFSTGNSVLASLDIITGYNGYATTADAAALEPADDFEFEIDGYVDTTAVGKSFLLKRDAFALYIPASGQIRSAILGVSTKTDPTGFNDPDADWTDEVDAYDNNNATGADIDNAVPASSWGSYIEFTIVATNMYGVRYRAEADIDWTQIDVDAYYDSQWNDVFQGAHADTLWEERYFTSASTESVTQMRIRFYNANVLPRTEDSILREVDFLTLNEAKSATMNTASGEHVVKTTADTVDLKIYEDAAEEASVALAGATVPDNANDWSWISNALPYTDFYKHTVSAVLIAWYQPVDMISGTTLPDREGVAQDGDITWGDNPDGVMVSLGGMTSSGQQGVGAVTDTPSRDLLPEVETSDWFVEPDISGSLATNPFRPFVTLVSDNTTITELQTWRWLGLAIVLLVTTSAIRAVPRHLAVACAAAGVATLTMVVLTIWPTYALILLLIYILGGWISERSPSL